MSEHVDERRPLSQTELRSLLERYFEGPITDEITERLHRELEEIRSRPARHRGKVASFHPENRVGEGYAWREEHSAGRRTPRASDLALFHTAATRGYPVAKLYCPGIFVGTWTQIDDGRTGETATWTLSPNGDLRTTNRHYAPMTQWSVHRSIQHPDSYRYSDLRVRYPTSPWYPLSIDAVSDDSLTLGVLRDPGGDFIYTLKRQPGAPQPG